MMPIEGVQRHALLAALKFLRPRSRFVAELREHLSAKGFPSTDVEYVVQFLVERKLLNDNQTTQNLVDHRSGKRSVGLERLRAELERLGAPEEAIEHSLAAVAESETENALEALRAKYRSGTDRARAGRFLYGRGFGEDAVETALDAFCGSTFPE